MRKVKVVAIKSRKKWFNVYGESVVTVTIESENKIQTTFKFDTMGAEVDYKYRCLLTAYVTGEYIDLINWTN